jgi:hypothetical protein
MNLDDSACMVTGFTITNGFTTSAGGGVYCINSTPAVTNCVLTGNKAGSGGGMMGGTVKNCLVVGNMALENGGGLASCLVSHCVVTNNAASSGGGMHGGTAWYSSFTSNSASGSGGGLSAGMARGCTFVGNRSTAEIWSNDGGGGLSGGTAIDCTFAGNVAGQGGAVLEGTVVNSVLTGNTASYAGGMYGGTAINCIIASNSATAEFGGMFLGTANNCIIYHNSAATSMNDSAGGIRRFSCSPDLPQGADGNITNAPLFMDTNGWVDLRLQSNSPCINAGNNAYVTMTNDLDGNPRIVGGTADMGAYEFQSPQSVISYAWLQHYGLPTDGSADHAHSDADPHNNWQEWKAWTDPTNELSVLKMLTPQPGTNGTSVSWQSVSGRTYTLERATNSNANWTVLESGISSQANTISFLDTTATNGETFFYRVGVPSE